MRRIDDERTLDILITDVKDAEQIALSRLQELEKYSGALAIEQSLTRTFNEGWLFFYNTLDFLNTENPSTRLVGNGPLFVKTTGELVILAPYLSMEASLSLLGITLETVAD
jgi:hypothetical protein